MIYNQYKQCGVTAHLSTEQNLLKKTLRKDKWWHNQWENLPDRSTDHKQANVPWFVNCNEQFTHGKIFEVDQLFANTDIAYFGPLLGNLNKKTQANQAKLQHGSIFCCLSSDTLYI